MSIEIEFQPIGRRVNVEPGVTILKAAQNAGVGLSAICGGAGTCGACRVKVSSEAAVTPPNQTEIDRLGPETLALGFRLACQAELRDSVRVEIPPESLSSPQRIQLEGEELDFDLALPIQAATLELSAPDQADLDPDWERLAKGMARAGIPDLPSADIHLLQELPGVLRNNDWRVKVLYRGREAVAVRPLDAPVLGLAIDIGTTKLAGYLLDLTTGRTLARQGAMNRQINFGEDVMSRLTYAMQEQNGMESLRSAVVTTINDLAGELCRQAANHPEGGCSETGCRPGHIVETVLVGNTAMHHLFLGLPVNQLGLSPYVPVISSAMDVAPDCLGLNVYPGGRVHLPPNIAGFVGSDHVAMLLASGNHRTRKTVVSVDIGTNTEITLTVGGKMISCSAASGPAFEGAHIQDGMRAAPGAIERVIIQNGRVSCQAIDHAPPSGICGSGILDAIAQLKSAGVVNWIGRLDTENPLVGKSDNGPRVVLAEADITAHGREVVVTQKDIGEIQLAKAAIRAGIEILLKHAGINSDQIDEITIAGAFGSYIDVRSALEIGMFPRVFPDRIRQIGNAAGAGARMTLLSTEIRRESAVIAEQIEYLELTGWPDFQNEFTEALGF